MNDLGDGSGFAIPAARSLAADYEKAVGVGSAEALESRCLLTAAVPINLSTAYDRTGIVADHSTFSSTGGFDAVGQAISGNLLGTTATWNTGLPPESTSWNEAV